MAYHEEAYNFLQSINQSNDEEYKPAVTLHMLVGAASFEALQRLDKEQEVEGQHVDTARAKQLLAGYSAASVDGFIDGKEITWIDKKNAKDLAKSEAELLYIRETGGLGS
ncbi:hypothetical protein BCR42DRAFT_429205 [Absidia repens]|uniref:Uncharacterized protein n=1 Tax=Absidia repens TaxID=90262 RepID=A0A1X2HXD1_9FUNG|nr:hypothetical protein BCR42DRAFT_429205 [Absidia repens]